jgi:hypothetical protein
MTPWFAIPFSLILFGQALQNILQGDLETGILIGTVGYLIARDMDIL